MHLLARVVTLVAFICCLTETAAYAQGSLLYVSNTNTDNNLSVYTTNTDGTLTPTGSTIPVGLNPIYATVRSDQAYAYVSNTNSRTISVIDTATQTVGQTVSVTASSDLYGIVLTPDGSKLYVSARASLTRTVREYLVDNITGQLTAGATINVLRGPRGIAMSPDGARLYVVNQTDESLQIIGTTTNTVMAATSTGTQPITVALNASGTRAYVANFGGGGSVSVYDTSTLATTTVPVGTGSLYSIAVTPDGNYFYVATRGDEKVHAFNASTFAEIGTGFSIGAVNGDLVISPDGLSLYVANGGPDNVSMFTINPSTGSLTPKVPPTIGTGLDPSGIAICRYGNSMLATGRIFVANTPGAISCMGPTPTFSGGTLRINGNNFTTAQSFLLGTNGGAIHTNGNNATFSGVISGSAPLEKVGAGTLTLSGANTFTGGTTVYGGTLTVDGSVASTITVRSGASIGGSGTINGDVILESGAIYLGGLTITGAVGNVSNVPELSSISPSQITAGSSATVLTLIGSDFVSGSIVRAGTTALTTTFRDANSLTAILPASLLASGAVLNISVVNPAPGGGTSTTRQLMVANPVPTITSVTPGYLVASSSSFMSLGLLGTNFVPSSIVRVNGSVRNPSFSSSTQISVPLIAADLASAGTLQIAIQNATPGGGTATAQISVVSSSDVKELSLNRGITNLQSDGTSSSVTTGYVGIRPATTGGSAPPAFVRLSASRGGVVVSETSEPAVVPIMSGRAFVQFGGSVNTGIAIANPNADAVVVSFFFTNSNGLNFNSGSLTVPAGGQVSQFVSDAPFSLPANTEASFTFSAARPVGVTVVRGTSNSKGDFLTTVMPLTDLALLPASGIVVPAFYDGGGWSTSVVLLNPANSVVFGKLQFIDRSSGQPLTLTVNGTLSNEFFYFLAPRASSRFTTAGTGSALTTGWIRTLPGLFALDPVMSAVLSQRSGTDVVAETGVSGVAASSTALVYAEATGNMLAATPGSAETSLVISNPGTTTATVSLAFSVINGAAANTSTTVTIPPTGQYAASLRQIAGFGNLPNSVQGILRISTTQNIGVAAFRNRYNERGELIVSALPPLPTSSVPADVELLVPQIVDGGGYKTSLILVNDSSAAAPVQVRTVSPSGQSLPALLK